LYDVGYVATINDTMRYDTNRRGTERPHTNNNPGSNT